VFAGSTTGSITGAINLTSTAGSGHTFNVSGSGGHSDSWNITSINFTAQPMTNRINLTSLPTANFNPVTLIQVATGTPDSGKAEDIFNLANQSLVTRYTFGYTNVLGQSATVTLKAISIDFNRAGLGDQYSSAVQLANAQVKAAPASKPLSANESDFYSDLMQAINLPSPVPGDGSTLQTLQRLLKAMYVDSSDQEAAATATGSSSDEMHSCGGDVRASINPASQGECNWTKLTYSRGERNGGVHRDEGTGLAAGRQWQIRDNLFIGLGAHYTETKFTSASVRSDGARAGNGGVVKYSNGRSFGSLSVLASYGWMDSVRLIALPFANGEVATARSNHKNLVLATRFRAGHRIAAGPFDMIGMVDFDMPLIHDYGYVEKGPSVYNLQVRSNTNLLLDIHPAIQIGAQTQILGMSMRGFGKVGRRFALNDIEATTSLIGGFDSDFEALTTHRRDDQQMTYGLGLIVDVDDQLEARLNYDLAEGREDRNERFSLKLALKF
jgi:hypothetical protein